MLHTDRFQNLAIKKWIKHTFKDCWHTYIIIHQTSFSSEFNANLLYILLESLNLSIYKFDYFNPHLDVENEGNRREVELLIRTRNGKFAETDPDVSSPSCLPGKQSGKVKFFTLKK